MNESQKITLTEEELNKIKSKSSNKGAMIIGALAIFSLLWAGNGWYQDSNQLKSYVNYYRTESQKMDSLYQHEFDKNQALKRKIILYEDSLRNCRDFKH